MKCLKSHKKSFLFVGIGLLLAYMFLPNISQIFNYEHTPNPHTPNPHTPNPHTPNPHTPNPLTPNPLTTVTHMAKDGKPVLITVINEAFLPFAHSWLCNTQFMEVHEQVMFIVTDVTSRKELQRNWPKVHVVDVTDLKHASEALTFSTAGYLRLMVYRTKLLYDFLLNNVDVFMFEVDAVWFQNPVYDIINRIGNNDIVVSPVTDHPGLYCGCLLYMRATDRTKTLWAKVNEQMQHLGEEIKLYSNERKIRGNKNDQEYLSALIRNRFGNITLTILPADLYPDGRWYIDKEKSPNPVLINNNWIVGRDAKIERAQKFKHWFWKMESHTCDMDLVRKTCKT